MKSTFIFENTEGNRLFNCTCTAKKIFVCFDDFQQADAGFYSLHSSAIDGTTLETITLRQASMISIVFWYTFDMI